MRLERNYETRGEAHLWRAVIVAALKDAMHGDEDALFWFEFRCRDFDLVCGLAGVDPDTVMEIAWEILTNGGKYPLRIDWAA